MATYVVADLHGCYDSFVHLLNLFNFNIDKDIVISAGDLIDKGPKSRYCLDFFKQYGMPAVMGNHEEYIPRYVQGNKIAINSIRKDTINQLGGDIEIYAKYINSMPLYLPFGSIQGSGYIVHAGIVNGIDMVSQSPQHLLRMRTFPYKKSKSSTALPPPWQNSYTGTNGIIIHGHAPCQSAQWHGNNMVYSLDGGAVYGNLFGYPGVLRGMRLDDFKIFEVKSTDAERKHFLKLRD